VIVTVALISENSERNAHERNESPIEYSGSDRRFVTADLMNSSFWPGRQIADDHHKEAYRYDKNGRIDVILGNTDTVIVPYAD